MVILGIETSCDETAAAVVKDGKEVFSNVVMSSLKEHKKFGGIIPELASRRQLEWIQTVVKRALKVADLTLDDIDAVAVTSRPGLIGSLLVGISFSRALSFSLNKPLINVDHIKAHLYANFLRQSSAEEYPQLPVVGLVVSGGHTSLYHIKNFDQFKLLGQTRDDAVGESFDKVARILDLGYPGGPAIDRLAKGVQPTGQIRFKCADLPKTYDFSFSGIKTAVLYYARDHKTQKDFDVAAVVQAFQQIVVSVLVKKSIYACQELKTKSLVVGGGVAANSLLRKQLMHEAKLQGIKVFFPSMSLCMDNAAMIAGLGYWSREKQEAKL